MTAIWYAPRQTPAAPPPLSRPVREDRSAPLRIALLNLMPNKPATERQFARALDACHRPVEWTLTLPEGYRPTTTPERHIRRFYTPWDRIDLAQLDGIIVTGAPVERLAFEQVGYWAALIRIFDQLAAAQLPSLFICWSAQAALYHRHGVAKRVLPEKCFGVFEQRILDPYHPAVQGLGAGFYAPVSRHTETRLEDIPANRGLRIVADSPDSGLCLVDDATAASLYMFNHLEYETETLSLEFERDRNAGRAVAPPRNYFARRLPTQRPINLWQSAAKRFFSGWTASAERVVRAGNPLSA